MAASMSLRNLNDNLAQWARTYGPDLAGGDAALRVARRVAALYGERDGRLHAPADTLCEKAVTLTVFEGDTRTFIALDELARYLFDGDR